MSPAEAAKWAERERPRYTVAQVVRYWCEIPDDHDFFLDRRTRLPVPDAAYPLVETYTLLLVDAIDTYQLPYGTTDTDWSNSEGPPPWSTRVIRQDALKRWFERCRWPQRPAFLFWREAAMTGPPSLDATPPPLPERGIVPMRQPQRNKDDWPKVITAVIGIFERQHRYTPNEGECWLALLTAKIPGYSIRWDDLGKVLHLADNPPLDRKSFTARYGRLFPDAKPP